MQNNKTNFYFNNVVWNKPSWKPFLKYSPAGSYIQNEAVLNTDLIWFQVQQEYFFFLGLYLLFFSKF